MAERIYTVTLKITRTYARKVAKGDKLDEVRRAVSRALPEGWVVEAGAVNLRSRTAKAEKREERQRRKLGRKAAKRKTERDAERASRQRRAKLRDEAQRQHREKLGDRRNFISEEIPSADRDWIVRVLDGERCPRDFDVRVSIVHTLVCDENTVIWVDYEWLRKLDVGGSARSYLAKRGCAVDFVAPVRMVVLHALAHRRRQRALRNVGIPGQLHGNEWKRALLNLIRKYEPGAFSENAQIVGALRGDA